jgi:hypothetical protein
MPLRHLVGGISVGVVAGQGSWTSTMPKVQAALDMNVIETDGQLVGSSRGRKEPFSRKDLFLPSAWESGGHPGSKTAQKPLFAATGDKE